MSNYDYCGIPENIDQARLAWNQGTYKTGEYLPCIPGLSLVPGEPCFVAPAVLGQQSESLVALRYQEFIRGLCRLESTIQTAPVKGLSYGWDSSQGYSWFNPDSDLNLLLNLASKGEVTTDAPVLGEFIEEGEGEGIRLPLSLWDILREVDLELFRLRARPGSGELYNAGDLLKYKEVLQAIPAVLAGQDGWYRYRYTWKASKEALLPLRQQLLQEALNEIGEDKEDAITAARRLLQ